MRGKQAGKLRLEMGEKVVAVEDTNCCDVVYWPHNAHVIHSNFVLKRKIDQFGTVKCHKARFVVCGNKENENEKIWFYSFPDCTVIKLLLCLVVHNNHFVKKWDFTNGFANYILERPVFVECLNYFCTGRESYEFVLELYRSLYGLNEATRIWFDLETKQLTKFGSEEMKNESCVFKGDKVIVVC